MGARGIRYYQSTLTARRATAAHALRPWDEEKKDICRAHRIIVALVRRVLRQLRQLRAASAARVIAQLAKSLAFQNGGEL